MLLLSLENHFGTNESLTLLLALYGVFTAYFRHNNGVSYREHHDALIYHVCAGVTELVLFYVGFNCSLLSVIATFTHSITGLMLVKNLRKGHSSIVRPSYQAGCVLRPLQILYAFHSGKKLDYHDAIVPLHSFVYARVIIFLVGTAGPTTDFRRNVNTPSTYTVAILGSALMAMGHCSNSMAVFVYLLVVHAIGRLSLWTRIQLDLCRDQSLPPSNTVKSLEFLGFYLFPPSTFNSSLEVYRGPEIGLLPADSLGHFWTRFGIPVFDNYQGHIISNQISVKDQNVEVTIAEVGEGGHG